MGQSMSKGETGGTPSKPKYMLAARDRSVAAVLGDKPAELIELVRFYSQGGKYAPEWRARRAQVGAFLMLSESSVKRVIRKCKASGVLFVQEVPEPMSGNGFVLHLSVIAEALEATKSKGREILQHRGWLDPLRAKATKGHNRPSVGNGSEDLQRPSEKVISGSEATLSSGKLRVPGDPLTTNVTNTSYKKNTHTGTAPVAALPTPSECEDKKHNNGRNRNDKNLRETRPVSPPPRSAGDVPPETDSPAVLSLLAVEKAWFDAVTGAYGDKKYVPPIPNKRQIEKVIQFGIETEINPIDYIRWFVARWETMRNQGKTKWMKLADFPIFSSVVDLAPRVLPTFLSEYKDRESWEYEVLPKEERELREKEALRRHEEEVLRLVEERRKKKGLQEAEEAAWREDAARRRYLYENMEVVPANHPLRRKIIQLHKKTGESIVASEFECLPLSKVPKEQHDALYDRWELMLDSFLYKKYSNMTFGSADEVPADHPDREELIRTFETLEKGQRLAALEGIGACLI